MPVLATCPSCSKPYRVPHRDKDWHCKACHDVLVFAEEPKDEAIETECTSCGALFFGNESFCAECGEDLQQTSEDKQQETREAAKEMRRAVRRVSRLKTWITYNLVVNVFTTLVIIPAVLLSDLETGMRVLLIGMQAVSLALAIFSRVQFDRRPFPILVSMAALQTLFAILAVLEGDRWQLSVAWAVGLWVLSRDAAQVARLARQYPDLYLSKRMRGEHLSSQGKGMRTESAAQRRIRLDAKRASKRFWLRTAIAGGTLLVALAAFLGYKAATAPPTPEATIAQFQAAWNLEDMDAVAQTAKVESRAKLRRSLGRIGEKFKWGTRRPNLESVDWESKQPERARARFEGEAGVLVVLFEYENASWHFTAIDFRNVKNWRPEK